MIALAPGTKVYLACKPVSMQKGFDGLSALAHQVLNGDPYSGHLFLFRGKRGDYFKPPWKRSHLTRRPPRPAG